MYFKCALLHFALHILEFFFNILATGLKLTINQYLLNGKIYNKPYSIVVLRLSTTSLASAHTSHENTACLYYKDESRQHIMINVHRYSCEVYVIFVPVQPK